MAATKTHFRVRINYSCPRCKADLERINRTSLDKIIGVLIPVRRYKCMGCFWEGLRLYQSHSGN